MKHIPFHLNAIAALFALSAPALAADITASADDTGTGAAFATVTTVGAQV